MCALKQLIYERCQGSAWTRISYYFCCCIILAGHVVTVRLYEQIFSFSQREQERKAAVKVLLGLSELESPFVEEGLDSGLSGLTHSYCLNYLVPPQSDPTTPTFGIQRFPISSKSHG